MDLRSRHAAFTLVALRDECRRLNLSSSGSRAELVARLSDAAAAQSSSSSSRSTTIVTQTTTITTTVHQTTVVREVPATPPPLARPAPLGAWQSERKPAREKRLSALRGELDDCDGGASSPAKRRLSVGFHAVEIREYERQHAGSGGVPYVGAYPLGLGWKIAAERRDSLSNFESERSSQRHKSDDLPRLDEAERRKLLEQHDARPRLQRAASYVAQRKELDRLRKARRDIGCACHVAPDAPPGEQCCKSDDCDCFRNGLECWQEACACGNTVDDCANPFLDKGKCSDVPPPPADMTLPYKDDNVVDPEPARAREPESD